MPEEPPPEAAFDNDDTEYRYSSRLSHRSQQPLVDICQLRTRLRTRLSAQEEAMLEALGLHFGGIPRIFPNLRDLSSLRLFIFKRTGTWWSSKDIGAKIRQWEEALRGIPSSNVSRRTSMSKHRLGFHERDFASSDWRSDKPGSSDSERRRYTPAGGSRSAFSPRRPERYYPSRRPHTRHLPTLPHERTHPPCIFCHACPSNHANNLRPRPPSRGRQSSHPRANDRPPQSVRQQPPATHFLPHANGFEVKNMNTYIYYLTSPP
ncbi:hypothetical protein NMY22_g9501 [Coprinellus aureogranulatus]|nr:hypothetical protein NMY22_g9501 [Coprinellus aureogranulatus]